MDIRRKPEWLRISRSSVGSYQEVSSRLSTNSLHTICQSGRCPNQAECWSRGTATFMILGDICTRNCRFCATKTGHPLLPDKQEPEKLATTIGELNLRHVVLTSVTRDDLPDEGAEHWKQCITVIRQANDVTIEVLLPDFNQREELLEKIATAKPDIAGHNIETVARLTPQVRSRATYEGSLKTLSILSSLGLTTKSGLMLGLGETEDEVLTTLRDLREAGVTLLTLGQYLQPSRQHYPVAEYIPPKQFAWWKQTALDEGFEYVESGPLVRSSYHAEKALWHSN